MAQVELTIVIISEAVNQPPVILPTLPAQVKLKVGETFDLAPHFKDPDNDPLIFSLKAPSTTISVTTAGIITALKPGNETVAIIASDGKPD